MLHSMVEAEDNSIQARLTSSAKPASIGFWEPWCGPCKTLAPDLTQTNQKSSSFRSGRMSKDFDEEPCRKAAVIKNNVDESHVAPKTYNVRSTPKLVLVTMGSGGSRGR